MREHARHDATSRPRGGRTGLRSRRGLTLVETLAAAAVLTIAVLGLSQVSLAANRLQQSGVQKAAVVRAIQQQIAQIQSTDFAALQATYDGAGFGVLLDGATNEALVPPQGDADGLAGSIAVVAPTGDPGELLDVIVRVDWMGRSGAQTVARTLRLSRVGSGS